MPYCCQCGTPARDTDRFCAKCGAPQARVAGVAGGPGAGPSAGGGAGAAGSAKAQAPDLTGSLTPRTASLLCYIPVVGWIPAIAVLASVRFRENRVVRFHAFQGLYLFVAWLILDWFVTPFFKMLPGMGEVNHVLVKILQVVLLGAWVLMLVKVSRDEHYRLPVVGDLAEKSVSEQG